MALGDWLGCYWVGILPNVRLGNWPIWIQRFMATAVMGLDQFQRFSPCEP